MKQKVEHGSAAADWPVHIPVAWNEISRRVTGAAIEDYRAVGPGLLARCCEEALVYELQRAGLDLQRQFPVRPRYKEIAVGEQRLDLVVARLAVVELKAVHGVVNVRLAQLVSHPRGVNRPLGLLIHSQVPVLKQGTCRRLNPATCPGRPDFPRVSVSAGPETASSSA